MVFPVLRSGFPASFEWVLAGRAFRWGHPFLHPTGSLPNFIPAGEQAIISFRVKSPANVFFGHRDLRAEGTGFLVVLFCACGSGLRRLRSQTRGRLDGNRFFANPR